MFLDERKLLEGFRPRIRLIRCMFLESVPAPLWRIAGWKTRARAPSQGSGTTQAPEAGDLGRAGDGVSQRNVQVTMTGFGDGLKGAGE